MKSFRSVLIAACIVLVAVPALADVTVKMSMSTAGGPVSVEMTMVTFIKGLKMRTDIKMMDQDMSMFVDVATKQQVMVNNVTKDVTDVAAAMAQMPMTLGEATVSVKPNGQTKDVLGRACAGYTVELAMPMTMNDETLTIAMSGTVWIAKDAPGVGEYQAFSKAAAAAGLMTSPVAQGPQAKGLAQMQATLAESGIPLEQQMQINITGSGQMAQMMAQSGAGSIGMTMKVTSVSADPIPAGTVELPAGYVKK